MPAMNLQIVWSIHVCIKLVWYCLEWKTLQLCGWLLPISCLRSLKRKSSLERLSLKHIVYCCYKKEKKHNSKSNSSGKSAYFVVEIKTLLQKVFFSPAKGDQIFNTFSPCKFLACLISRCTSYIQVQNNHTFAGKKNFGTKNNLIWETNDRSQFRRICTFTQKINNFKYRKKVQIPHSIPPPPLALLIIKDSSFN